jgi:hypothetical protein
MPRNLRKKENDNGNTYCMRKCRAETPPNNELAGLLLPTGCANAAQCEKEKTTTEIPTVCANAAQRTRQIMS